MAGEWRDMRWGEIVTLEYGKGLRGYESGEGPYRVYGTNGPIGWHDQFLSPNPTVVIGRKGAYRGVHYSAQPCFVIDTAFYLKPRAKFDMRWAYYALLTHDIDSMDSGSAIPSTSRDSFYQLPVRFPPLEEQRAIAHILGTLDDKIELNRRMNETLEATARAIFKSWFVDFDPVRAKAEGRQPYGMDAETAAIFPDSFQNSPLGKIPKGWRIGGFPDEIDFLEGPGLRNWQYRTEGIKFLNIRCIDQGDLLIEKANCISEAEFHEKYSHFSLQAGDIVISTSGTLGRLAIVRADHLPIMLNTSIIRMRGKNPVGLAYVWATLQSDYFLEEMFALASGSVQLNFGPMHLRRMKLLKPSDHVLKQFENVAGTLLGRALANRQESKMLACIRDALLPKLISGEVRVKDAERIVGGAL